MITKTIAEIFFNIAKILELKGENTFRIRAYERAAQNIESLTEDIQDIINDGRLTEIPGIGKDLAEKIKEIAATKKLAFFEELKKTIPEGLIELLRIPGIGPKHAKLFYEELGIKGILELEKAAKEGKLLGLEGIKEKTVENILKGIALVKKGRERMDLATAIAISQELIQALKTAIPITQITACGSLRRMKETVRDIDILITAGQPEKVMDAFVSLPQVKDVSAKGLTKSSILTKDGAQVDVRIVDEKSYGAALVYFTGSKNFNIKIRRRAIKKKLKVNEYGVFKAARNRETYLCGKTEEEVFQALGLEYIPPELREDTGEIELASRNKLPNLVTLKDIRGDFHAHSTYSDGNNSIEEMVQTARGLGYGYINITDHSQGLKVARGLSPESLKKKKAEIEKLNSKLKDFRALFGSEVDIDSSGKLDYPDTLLAGFDIVVAAIHSGFTQSKSQLTKRLASACKNPHVDIIAHPTGKLWGARDSYEVDFDEVCKAALDNGTILEINAYPLRLDLNDNLCRKAKEKGLKLAIATDAHTTGQLKNMYLGVATARRGWLEKKDIINTLSYEEVMKLFEK